MLICWTGVCVLQFHRHRNIQALSQEVAALIKQARALEKKKELYNKIIEKNCNAPGDYLKHTVETCSLLQDEQLRVSALARKFPHNPSLKERMHFLKSNQNKICFDIVPEGPHLSFRLHQRVQMDVNDLRKFLEAVETDRYDINLKKPFFLVKKFDLLKSYEKGDEKVYSIDVELLQWR